MADITTRTFGQLVQGQAAAIQSRAAGLVDVSIGAICRALIEATASVALWLQSNIMALLATTRLTTSTGSDVDTWIADWGAAPLVGDPAVFARLAAATATGSVTFSRFSTVGQALIPVGATVSTADGSQSYAVTVDTTVNGYSQALDGYLLTDTQASITVPVQAVTSGASANAVVGAVNTITSAIAGIDTVTNAAAITNGADAETDDQVRIRFRSYIKSLREGTPAAVKFIVENLKRGVTAIVIEGQEQSGAPRSGFFYVIVDDGTGAPSQELIDAASAAVDVAHAAGVQYAIFAPEIITCNVQITVTLADGADSDLATTAVQNAISGYLSTLAVGSNVLLTRLYQIVYDATPDVQEATGATLNGAALDLTISKNLGQVAKPGTIAVIVT